MTEKIDLKRELRAEYAPRNHDWQLVDVPPASYLTADGVGDPNTSAEYKAAVEYLFTTSYSLKMASKKAGRDYVVMPLEGLWWSDRYEVFEQRKKADFKWTMMIRQPDWINPPDLELKTLHEGLCMQLLHIGSYDDEAPALARLHNEVMPELGLEFNGLHHEIYLSDPRRTTPEKLRTILRQPVKHKDS